MRKTTRLDAHAREVMRWILIIFRSSVFFLSVVVRVFLEEGWCTRRGDAGRNFLSPKM